MEFMMLCIETSCNHKCRQTWASIDQAIGTSLLAHGVHGLQSVSSSRVWICLILWMLAKSCTTLDGWNPIGINMDKPSTNLCKISSIHSRFGYKMVQRNGHFRNRIPNSKKNPPGGTGVGEMFVEAGTPTKNRCKLGLLRPIRDRAETLGLISFHDPCLWGILT